MSVSAIKEEAIRQFALKVEAMDDEASLKIVLDFLNGIGKKEENSMNLSSHYESIKVKYASVLEKLAK
ncbi:MAG: hypothetical protein JWQ38_419 [Flavipsychrobacter sp.]|nr:hypothetical protein [Flavipsychrobacter sp.]